MTRADGRMLELLRGWQRNCRAELEEAALSPEDWQREYQHFADVGAKQPTRKAVEFALRRLDPLIAEIERRIEQGDEQFSVALEWMHTLTTIAHFDEFEQQYQPLYERGARDLAARRMGGAASARERGHVARAFVLAEASELERKDVPRRRWASAIAGKASLRGLSLRARRVREILAEEKRR